MVNQLSRQIDDKQRVKHEERELHLQQEQRDLDYQSEVVEQRKRENVHILRQDPLAYHHYQGLVEKQHQRQRHFDYTQIDREQRRRTDEEVKRANEKDHEARANNQRVKDVLDQQVLIHQQKKREDEQVNPEQLTYGLLGRIMSKPYNPATAFNAKQQYYQDLQGQIQEKQRKKQSERYMNDE